MKTTTRSLISCLALSAALAFTVSTAQAGTVVYKFIPVTGIYGSVFTGSITANDADNNGWVTAAEISLWSFTSTGYVNFSISSADSDAQFQAIGTPGAFSVTSSTLSFDFGSTVPNNPFANFSSGQSTIEFLETEQGGSNPVTWSYFDHSNMTPLNDSGQYASNLIATAVPETSTSAMLIGGLGSLIAFRRRR